MFGNTEVIKLTVFISFCFWAELSQMGFIKELKNLVATVPLKVKKNCHVIWERLIIGRVTFRIIVAWMVQYICTNICIKTNTAAIFWLQLSSASSVFNFLSEVFVWLSPSFIILYYFVMLSSALTSTPSIYSIL